MTNIIERVGRAMFCVDNQLGPNSPEDYRAMARAAIEAMREPNDAMVDAGLFDGDAPYAREGWQAMIDEALRT